MKILDVKSYDVFYGLWAKKTNGKLRDFLLRVWACLSYHQEAQTLYFSAVYIWRQITNISLYCVAMYMIHQDCNVSSCVYLELLRAIVCKNQTGRDSDGHEIFFPSHILEVYIWKNRVQNIFCQKSLFSLFRSIEFWPKKYLKVHFDRKSTFLLGLCHDFCLFLLWFVIDREMYNKISIFYENDRFKNIGSTHSSFSKKQKLWIFGILQKINKNFGAYTGLLSNFYMLVRSKTSNI